MGNFTASSNYIKVKTKPFKKKHILFRKNVVTIPVQLIEPVCRKGNVKFLTLWMKLKRDFRSGHFHSFDKKPSWYPGSKETFRRHINNMVELKWIVKEKRNKGFRLISYQKLWDLELNTKQKEKSDYCKKFKSFDNCSFSELLFEIQKYAVRINYMQQIDNIAKVNTNKQNIVSEKLRDKWFEALKRKYLKNVCMLADLKRQNRTSLSCKGMGKLFGKSEYYGNQIYHQFIDDGFLTRKMISKKLPYPVSTFHKLKREVPYPVYLTSKGIFRKKTSFVLNDFVNEDLKPLVKKPLSKTLCNDGCINTCDTLLTNYVTPNP